MEYKTWEAECNTLMLKQHGVGIDDIPDMLWHDWWKYDKYEPQEAVDLAIKTVNEGGF